MGYDIFGNQNLIMVKVVVNGKKEKTLEKGMSNGLEETFVLDGETKKIDILPQGEASYHVLCENKSYQVSLLKVDYKSKEVLLKVNGNSYTVVLKDENDLLLERLGMSKLTKGKVKDLKAPMPGMVLDVLVKPGDLVKTGDPLVILEAMKMENALKSPGDLEVKKVIVKKNQTVEKGQVLVAFS